MRSFDGVHNSDMPLDKHSQESLQELCRRFRVKRLWLFGSAAREDFDLSANGIDLLVEFDDPDGMSPAAQYFDFLEELQILFGRKVDLVEKKAVRNPFFLKAIAGQERLLYAA